MSSSTSTSTSTSTTTSSSITTTTTTSTTTTTIWVFVDGNGPYGINYDRYGDATNPQLTVYGSSLYAIWEEEAETYQIRVKKYSGSGWTSADNFTPLNDDGNAAYSQLTTFGSNLCATYSQYYKTDQIRVKEYNGSTWSSIDGGGGSGIEYFSAGPKGTPQLTVFNSNLYAIWQEAADVGLKSQIRLKRYQGSSSWTTADNSIGINYSTLEAALKPQLTVYGSSLYSIWQEESSGKYQIRVKKYDGSTWESADGSASINYDAGQGAQSPQLTVFGADLYAAWVEEYSSTNQVRIKKYNGSTWTFVDGNGSTGINYNTSRTAFAPQLTVYNGNLYAIWSESNGSTYQIRVKRYDAGSTWTSIDGNGINGINYDATKGASRPQLTVFDGKLYATWYEPDRYFDKYQIRVAKYSP